jgi:hypothetical protein
LADWSPSAETIALVRQAADAGWDVPRDRAGRIVAALVNGLDGARPLLVVRVARLLLHLDRITLSTELRRDARAVH